jgi:hypothetical protein
VSTKHDIPGEQSRHQGDPEVEATLTSIRSVVPDGDDFTGHAYEPWLFQTMLSELTEKELGVGFIYTVLDLFAKRNDLTDAVVVLVHESFGTQMFRLGGKPVTPEIAAKISAEPGVYCALLAPRALQCGDRSVDQHRQPTPL